MGWISRTLFSMELMEKKNVESKIPKIIKYGRILQLLNSLNGYSELTREELTDNGWKYDLNGSDSDDVCEILKIYGIIQLSSDNSKIEFLTNYDSEEIFQKMLKEQDFGKFQQYEIIFLKILKILQSIRYLSSNELFSIIDSEFSISDNNSILYQGLINFMYQFNFIEEIINPSGDSFIISRINFYGDFDKAKTFCQKNSSLEINKVGEALDYIDKKVGIPDISIAPEILEGIDLAVKNGLINTTIYDFGTDGNPNPITFYFPNSKDFSNESIECGRFDKKQASLGMLIYGTKIAKNKLMYPQAFVNGLLNNTIKSRTDINDIFRQYCPMFFAGMIYFDYGISSYWGPITQKYRDLEGYKPKLLNNEENRDILQSAFEIYQKNEDFGQPSSLGAIHKSKKIKYKDTAGKSLKIDRSKHIFDIILNKKFRKGN